MNCMVPYYSGQTNYPKISKSTDDYIAFVETVTRNFIDTNYQSIKLDTTNHPPIDSLIRQTDSRSSIFYTKENDTARFGGIGMQIRIRNNWPIVVSPIEYGPAYKAGIIPDDTLIKVGEFSTYGISLDSVIYLLRGDIGSITNLSIKRNNDTLVFNDISREFITIQSIPITCAISDDIGYIRISNFDANTAYDIEKDCDSLLKVGCKVFIIDIRNNNGGLLPAAINTTELFLLKGKRICLMKQLPNIGDKEYISSSGKFCKLPILLLVNNFSYSGAEILAIALKENERAILIGTKTAGYGYVQTLLPIRKSYSIRLTTGYLFGPNDKPIEKIGVLPDIIIEEPKSYLDVEYPKNCHFDKEIIKDKQLIVAIEKANEMN